jgi:hypothetical protein
MARTRFLGIAALAVALFAAQRQPALSQHSPNAANDLTCKVYSLTELGDDPSLGAWVAETIPEVIQPDSWK